MYIIFVILFKNYEKGVHAHNYRFFWKELFYLWKLDWIFKVICSGWVNMTPPQNHHIGRRANPILIYKSLATYLNNSKSKKC